ncbi:hypothetical protein D3C72_2148980 [compost metagenome]
MTSGSTFSASSEPPGRSGASHSSQARPSTIRPTRLPTAAHRVARTEEGGSGVSDTVAAKEEEGAHRGVERLWKERMA